MNDPQKEDRIDDLQFLHAFARARNLLDAQHSPSREEVLEIEETLRPGAAVVEVRNVVIPLLDRAAMPSLAMAWDCDVFDPDPSNAEPRLNRWLRLGAPEFAMHALAALRRAGRDIEHLAKRVTDAFEQERTARRTVLMGNLDCLRPGSASLADQIANCPRTAVALRPLGAGLAQRGGTQLPVLDIFGTTPEQALDRARQLLRRVSASAELYLAGAGDGALCWLAATEAERPVVRMVEPDMARVRAILELADFGPALREGRLEFFAGTDCAGRLRECFSGSEPNADTAVLGASVMAHKAIQEALGRSDSDNPL